MIQTSDSAHEGLLSHILSFVVLSHHSEAERVDFISKQVDELSDGGIIPRPALLDQ